MHNIYRQSMVQLRTESDLLRREWQLFAFLTTDVKTGVDAPSTDAALPKDRRTLLRASSNYFVLYALHSINISKKVPHVRCASRLLQSDAPLILDSEYRFGAPTRFL
jgi:hypothetical protein